jgi:hypothetical protein
MRMLPCLLFKRFAPEIMHCRFNSLSQAGRLAAGLPTFSNSFFFSLSSKTGRFDEN